MIVGVGSHFFSKIVFSNNFKQSLYKTSFLRGTGHECRNTQAKYPENGRHVGKRWTKNVSAAS
jgi:hypothetical protein